MTGPVEPIKRTVLMRRTLRPQQDNASSAGDTAEETVFSSDEEALPHQERRDAFAAFAAHLMGQHGQKRGLRGGPQVLDVARSTYLGTEYSGPRDRRPRAGLIRKTEI